MSPLNSVIRPHNNPVALDLHDLIVPNHIERIKGSCILQDPRFVVVSTKTQVDAIFQGKLVQVSKYQIELAVHLIQDAGRIEDSLLPELICLKNSRPIRDINAPGTPCPVQSATEKNIFPLILLAQ